MADVDIFRLRDEYLAAHPEMEQSMRVVRWCEWAERQMLGVRLVERRYRDGDLLSERDVTPPDPEPTLE